MADEIENVSLPEVEENIEVEVVHRVQASMGCIPYMRYKWDSLRTTLMRAVEADKAIICFSLLIGFMAFSQATALSYFRETGKIWALHYRLPRKYAGNEQLASFPFLRFKIVLYSL